ncbi:MAG: hypothetical protein IID40_07445 [Planctomycetes bacterium]|nr:hypothetical protein [Planctomycetota bacterium]
MPPTVDQLNLIKNPRLSQGAKMPRGWQWLGNGQAVGWSRDTADRVDEPTMVVHTDLFDEQAGWSRRVPCKANEHYRVEIVVSGSWQAAAGDEGAGFVLSVRPLVDGVPQGRAVELTAPPRMDQPTILRGYYQVPPKVRSVELRMELLGAKGRIRIHEVIAVQILEPEAKSHVHAAVPPPYVYPPPRLVKSICVCTSDENRPIVGLLRRRFGTGKVGTCAPERFAAENCPTDAVLLPDEAPPRSIRSLSALHRLAEKRLVVVSLPAFARLAGKDLAVRTVAQGDDPIHAKVCNADFITRGFAIADVLPWAWRSRDLRKFVQRHLRKGRAFKALGEQHGYQVVLDSVCCTDASSDHPVCLFRPTEAGGVVVLDIEAAEATATNFDEPDLALFLVNNALGLDQNVMGQYVSPARDEKEFRNEVDELGQRYPALVVHGGSDPDLPRRDQCVELGGRDEGFGLQLVPRPLIMIRTGLRGDDLDGVYGTMLWLKGLVRPAPFACPYATALFSRYRLAWLPLGAEWHAGCGWVRPRDTAVFEADAEFEPGSTAAVIDLTSTAQRRVRVAVSDRAVRERLARHLPGLLEALIYRRFFYRCVGPGEHLADRAAMQWRPERLDVEVTEPQSGHFASDLHARAAEAGAALIRLEFPGPTADLSTGSIWRTNLAASTLEQVVGLLYGWMVMNRQGTPLKFTPPDAPAGASLPVTKMHGIEAITKQRTLGAKGQFTLHPGEAAWVAR